MMQDSNVNVNFAYCDFCGALVELHTLQTIDDGGSLSMACKQCKPNFDSLSTQLHTLAFDAEAIRKTKVCDKVKELVYSERATQYGPFEKNAQRVLDIYLAIKGDRAVCTPEDVCIFMVAFKLAREGTKHKRDNLIDAAGYIELWDQIKETEVPEIKGPLPF